MFVIYLIIDAAILALAVWNFVTEKDWKAQAAIAMVTVPLLLRLLLVK
ncbi:MAG: hypothetical protein LBR23_07185 [Spirochaetaceae bacterium]|jgi:hypothetical protein|nr:hypothetical protein [Spirochaetaceae bacterium]